MWYYGLPASLFPQWQFQCAPPLVLKPVSIVVPQVNGKVPTVSIDKTDGCQVFLGKDGLKTEIVTSKSSEMNIMIPKPDGDYVSTP